MGISMSHVSWMFNTSKNAEKDLQVAEYLDHISAEAETLARLWESVAGTVLQTGVADANDNTTWTRLVERPEWTIYSKSIPRSRLELFYHRLSRIINKSHDEQPDFFICRIGLILQKQRLTRQIVEEQLRNIKHARLFQKNAQVNGELTIEESISLANREVLALSALAKEYRNKIR